MKKSLPPRSFLLGNTALAASFAARERLTAGENTEKHQSHDGHGHVSAVVRKPYDRGRLVAGQWDIDADGAWCCDPRRDGHPSRPCKPFVRVHLVCPPVIKESLLLSLFPAVNYG